jgi:hypothetical protein
MRPLDLVSSRHWVGIVLLLATDGESQTSQPRRLEIPAQWYRNRHGEPPSFATLNQNRADLGIVGESQFLRFGMRHWLRPINIIRQLVAISGLIRTSETCPRLLFLFVRSY